MRKKKAYFDKSNQYTKTESEWVKEMQAVLNKQPRSLVITAGWDVLDIHGKRGFAMVISGRGLVKKYGDNS